MQNQQFDHGMRRSQLQKLLSAPEWQTFLALANKVKDRYRTGSKKGQSEFETLWKVAHSEGAVEGIEVLLQEIFSEASKLDQ